jgi:glycosyl transferase family 25
MDINSYFDKIVCINLKRRHDRWEESKKEFEKHGINVLRIDAVDGNPMGWTKGSKFPGRHDGALGCIASHVNVYKMAKENGWKNVLIIEDDCEFIDNLNEKFKSSIKTLPEDWDMLYFGGTHKTKNGKFIPDDFNQHFVKAKRILTTSCYAVNNTMYDIILNKVLEREPTFETTIDGYLAVYIQPICKTYAYHPPIAWQRASHSDVQNDFRDYSHLRKNNIRD